MDIYECMRVRRSIRKYKQDDVSEEKLTRILDAVRIAPSAKNLQPWKFIIVKDKETKKKLAEAAYNQKFVEEAPIVIVGCGDEKNCFTRVGDYMSSYHIDLTIAFTHLVLAAESEGLGTCWIAKFNEKKVKDILDVPEGIRVVALTPLGYADEAPEMKTRKSIAEIVYYDKWGAT